MGRVSLPNAVFVEARAVGRKQRPTLIILDSSGTSTIAGSALARAMTFHQTERQGSVHYVVDESTAFTCVKPIMEAIHSEDYYRSVLVELCDDPVGEPLRWEEQSHSLMLSKAAGIVAELCLFYGIHPRYVSRLELQKWRKWRRKGRGGILIRGDLAHAYWPDDYFLSLVKAHIEAHKYGQSR